MWLPIMGNDADVWFSSQDTNLINFHGVQEICIDLGGRIYEPRDVKVTNSVVAMAEFLGITTFWAGVADVAIEGT